MTDPYAEDHYRAIERYGRDLTKLSKEGRLAEKQAQRPLLILEVLNDPLNQRSLSPLEVLQS